MYKSKLQELCQRRSWNLPEYTTAKDGPDHIPRFTTVVVVNGQSFETPALCKSAKDAQNTAARIAFDHFNVPPPPRVHQLPSSSLAAAVPAAIQPPISVVPPPIAPVPEMHLVAPVASLPAIPVPVAPLPLALPIPPLDPEIQLIAPVASLPAIPVPVAPLPSALPIPPPGLLVANNNSNIKPASREIMQPNCEDAIQTSMVYRTQIGSHDVLHMFKNRLQQYAQKQNLGLPVYTCESEGPPHARRFKSRVAFDGKSYETLEFFATLKEAEHAAARVACQMLSINEIQEDGGLYKNLLQELAQKEGFLCPSYQTVRSGMSHRPIFISTVEIGSSTFRGDEAKTKKHAEMNAAKVAYCALTENSPEWESSKLSSRMGSGVVDDLAKSVPPAERKKKDEDTANEETLICPKRTKSSTEKETTHLLASADNCSSSQSILADTLTEQPAEAFHSKTVVFHRKSNLPIPSGASVMPYSDDQWVAYKVKFNKEPTA